MFKCEINKPKYHPFKFVCRKIEYDQVSAYLIEELNLNVSEQKQLSNPYIQPIKGIAIGSEQVYIVSPYFENGSLQEFIDKNQKLEYHQIVEYLKQVAEGMDYLHSQSPSIFHSSLHSNNIMIYKDQVKVENCNNISYQIVDFGFQVLKKYISLTNGYTTKSQYTAPELLLERSNIPSGTMAGDVYSFGILTWELFHGTKAYQNIQIKELIRINSQEQKRPKIDASVPDDIKLLIRSCWQQDPLKRPSFEKVLEYLNNGSDTSLTISQGI